MQVQPGLMLHQVYIPEKGHANQTQNYHLKQCSFLVLGH